MLNEIMQFYNIVYNLSEKNCTMLVVGWLGRVGDNSASASPRAHEKFNRRGHCFGRPRCPVKTEISLATHLRTAASEKAISVATPPSPTTTTTTTNTREPLTGALQTRTFIGGCRRRGTRKSHCHNHFVRGTRSVL